jgi:group II intron reverse transcriptase/maturase
MGSPETCAMTGTKLKRIAWLSASDPDKRFDSLIHHFNEASLAACFDELDGTKAVGIDGVTKAQYGENLEENLHDLVARMKRMAYRPQPIRQALIPKEGQSGATRPLGISILEDKIVQKMMQKVLESIYEPLFFDCSYGFRPGRGCHDAISALYQPLYGHDVQIIIEVDLANFFGTIDQQRLVELLREKIGDERLIRYLIRMFKAGMLSDGELVVSEEGVVQGSICSPVLANVFAHYVIDSWFETTVKPHCRGRVALFRYADDAVICCQYEQDAQRIKAALAKRLAKYGLKLNEQKTHLVRFSKQAKRRGEKAGSFDFLGLTFYLGRSRRGYITPKVKTSGKRLRGKLKQLGEWAKRVRNGLPLKQIWALFQAKVRGHIQYYGVSFNTKALNEFVCQARRIMFRHLNRRSQRKSFTWEQFDRFNKAYPLPPTRIHHALY